MAWFGKKPRIFPLWTFLVHILLELLWSHSGSILKTNSYILVFQEIPTCIVLYQRKSLCYMIFLRKKLSLTKISENENSLCQIFILNIILFSFPKIKNKLERIFTCVVNFHLKVDNYPDDCSHNWCVMGRWSRLSFNSGGRVVADDTKSYTPILSNIKMDHKKFHLGSKVHR